MRKTNQVIKLTGSQITVYSDPVFVFGRLASMPEVQDLDERSSEEFRKPQQEESVVLVEKLD